MAKKRSKSTNRSSSIRRKRYLRFLSYLPLALAIIGCLVMNGWSVKPHVLSYATNMSIGDLLADSNSSRAANGVGALTLNAQLNSAAQAKANDMVARNYWSHVTPDGQQPWVFINNAGYQYTSAAENLAYGFSDSASTITGWMNSAEHRANLLNGSFTNVGFGFSNSDNFNGSGPQTVVVAMYAAPKAVAAPAPAATTPKVTPTAPSTAPQPAAVAAAATTDATNTTTAQPAATTKKKPATVTISKAVAVTDKPKPRIDFVLGAIAGMCIVALIIKKGLYLRRYLVKGERFVLHHPLFDSVVVGVFLLVITASQAVGYIK